MSIYKSSSLAMIPTAYKDGKLYSIRPTDGSGDFTFSRGSNLAATRVDVNGLIEKGRENLVTYSNDFSHAAWSKIHSGGTTPILTSGFTDPNGGSNAWRLQCSMTGGLYAMIQQGLPSSSDVEVASIYIKSNTGADQDVYFRINNTDQTTTRTATTSWQRIEVYANVNGKSLSIGVRSAATGSTSSCDVLIYAAQAEKGLVATDYIETGTSAAQSGILEDMPRLDYSGGASCPSLLLEPQRLNQVSNSEYYGSYAFQSASISQNETTSPEGLQNAAELIEDSSNDNHFFRIPNLSWTSGTDVVFSIYLKENTRRYARLRFDNSGSNTRAWLDLRTGEITFIDAGAENGVCTSVDYGNGWFKYDFKITAQNTGTGSVQVFTQSVESVTGSLQTTYQGDGTSGIYVWGAQVETGSYPTSYIPTYGTSQTRSVDSCLATGVSDLIGQTQGTLFAEFEMGVDNAHFFLYTNTSNAIYIQTRIGDMWRAYVIKDGVYQVTITLGSVPTSGFVKMAFAYNENDFALYANGNLIGSDTSGSVPTCDSFDFGLGPYGAGYGAKRTKQTILFPTRLTNAELAALTTI